MSAFKKFEGITQKQLAEYWGVSTSNLRKYVVGERPLSPTLIYKMAATFETSPKLWLDIQSKNQLFKKLIEIDKIKSAEKEYSLEELIRA